MALTVRRAELTRAESWAGLVAGWIVWQTGHGIVAGPFDTRAAAREALAAIRPLDSV